MPKYSYKDGTTYTAKSQVDGVLIDPKLPARFDNTPNEKRPDSQTKWWAFPFIVTDGEAYETRCLDGGAWDRSTSWGTFAKLSEAVARAKTANIWRTKL